MSTNQGMSGVRRAKEELDERKAAGAALYGTTRLSLKSGEQAIVRFLHQGEDVRWNWTHTLPKTGNQQYGDATACLDQSSHNPGACPFCAAGEKRTFKGYMPLIWRNAPQYQVNAEGYRVKDAANRYTIVGYADQVALWISGITVFDQLDRLDTEYHGLTTRDTKITRSGTGLSTTYHMLPADMGSPATPLSDIDRLLFQTNPVDIDAFMKPLTYQELASKLGAVQAQPQPVPGQQPPQVPGIQNPFLGQR